MNKKRIRRVLLSTLTVLLLGSLLSGNSTAMAQYQTVLLSDPIYVKSLSGHVQDGEKNLIVGAKVELRDFLSGRLLASTSTDLKGDFHFEGFTNR